MPQADGAVKKKRHQVRAACGLCRSKKSACDGVRPACNTCVRRGLQCVYVTCDSRESRGAAVRRELDSTTQTAGEYEEVLRYFRDAPEAKARGLLRYIRQHADISTALSCAPRNVSMTPGAAQPKFDFDALPGVLAQNAAAIHGRRAATQSLPAAGAAVQQIPPPGSGPRDHPSPGSNLDPMLRPTNEAQPTGEHLHRRASPSKPVYCDERLRRLSVRHWTTVGVSDEQAAAMVSLYLETDHPILGLFDANIFVESLVFHTPHFCSPLLFNALLFWASGYASCDPTVAPLVPMFLEEAQQLWNLERINDSITTASAAQFLSMGCSAIGQNSLGVTFMVEGTNMAKRLGLLGRRDGMSAAPPRHDSAIDKTAAAHVAWGIFNWLALRSFQFHHFTVTCPPDLPIPGDGYASSTPTSGARTFAALCKFWLIANKVNLLYYPEGDEILDPACIPLSSAEDVYERLMRWTDDHSALWNQGAGAPHHVAMTHMYLHCVIMDTFRPFLTLGRRSPPDEHTTKRCPDTIFMGSLAQLQRYVRLYPIKYQKYSEYSMVWHTACVYVINAALAEPTERESRRFFDHCLEIYLRLSRLFPVALALIQGFLAMAVRADLISSIDAGDVYKRMDATDRLSVALSDADMDLKIDLAASGRDSRAARLNVLAEEFQEKFMFETFVISSPPL